MVRTEPDAERGTRRWHRVTARESEKQGLAVISKLNIRERT